MTVGTVTAVESRRLGSELLADTAAGATTLAVDLGVDFDEDGGQLLLNGATLDYTAVDVDGGVITLAVPLAADASADDPVVVVDAGVEAVEWVAHVAVDEGDQVAAVIPTALIAYFPEGTYDEPVQAEIVQRGGGYEVASQPARDASFDGAAVWNPYVIQSMNSLTVPDSSSTSTFTQVTSWTVSESVGVTTGSGLTIQYPGVYYIAAQNSWTSSSTGRRVLRVVVNGAQQVGYTNAAAEDSSVTYVSVFALARLDEGDVVTIELRQTSGASLAIGVGFSVSRLAMYRVSI